MNTSHSQFGRGQNNQTDVDSRHANSVGILESPWEEEKIDWYLGAIPSFPGLCTGKAIQ